MALKRQTPEQVAEQDHAIVAGEDVPGVVEVVGAEAHAGLRAQRGDAHRAAVEIEHTEVDLERARQGHDGLRSTSEPSASRW